MKYIFLLILCCCLVLFFTAYGNTTYITHPPFVRSRYSLRWRQNSTISPLETTGRAVEMATSSEHSKILASSTANGDYDYYGNGEMDNNVHK
ncbi:uncharacterized protein LOC115621732 [Scaptodrosophila lebanonensis]|uniref:Uncharacterized protein LOC115621732 n=1 Tax=Drosophila lebanonensis TaxID=7225 RepID=A0A6J2T8Q5_DROLE|nr:uncharacterized protein LOC115621732 [Scaptodrosophila lebanonensis]